MRRGREPYLVEETIGEVAGDVGRAVVAEQSWLVDDLDPVAARCLQGQLEVSVTSSDRMVVRNFHAMM